MNFNVNFTSTLLHNFRGFIILKISFNYSCKVIKRAMSCLCRYQFSFVLFLFFYQQKCFFVHNVFLQLKMYGKCLLDLDLARFSNYPRKFSILLKMREADCLRLLADGGENDQLTPKLSINPNENYPEMADVDNCGKIHKIIGKLLLQLISKWVKSFWWRKVLCRHTPNRIKSVAFARWVWQIWCHVISIQRYYCVPSATEALFIGLNVMHKCYFMEIFQLFRINFIRF